MQDINIYLIYDSGKVTLVNESAAVNVSQEIMPTITRDLNCNLILNFLTKDGEEDTSISDFSAWEFAVTNVFGTENSAVILTTSEIVKEGGKFTIPIDANTVELIAALGTKASLTTYGATLKGFDASANLAFVIDFNITLRNIRNPGGGGPTENIINYYTKAQVDAKVNALFDWADPYDFTTNTETGATITFTAAALGVDAESCDFDVIQIDGDNKNTITNDTSIFRKWTPDGYVVMYTGGWPAGTWQLRAGKVKGDAGRDGEDYDRVTVADNTLTVQRGPKEYYWTAVSGASLVIDRSAIVGLDKVIHLIITMPSPAVSFTWPSGITWKDIFGNTLTSSPDMSVAGEYHFAFKQYANGFLGRLLGVI